MLIPSTDLPDQAKTLIQTSLNAKNIISESDEWYYADRTMVTNSHLKKLNEGGPQHLKAYYEKGQSDSAAFKFGRAFHCKILEPQFFDRRYFVLDDEDICKKIGGARPRTTNKYKEWADVYIQENAGKDLLSTEDYNDILAMEKKLLAIPQFNQIMQNTQREVIYKGILNGIPVKCKLDLEKPNVLVGDIKTMSDAANPKNVLNFIKKYGVDQQAAFYCDIVGVKEFTLICIEKDYPHTIGIYFLGEEILERGRVLYRDALADYKRHFIDNVEGIDTHYYQGML